MLGEDHNVSMEHLLEDFQPDSSTQSDPRKVRDQGKRVPFSMVATITPSS